MIIEIVSIENLYVYGLTFQFTRFPVTCIHEITLFPCHTQSHCVNFRSKKAQSPFTVRIGIFKVNQSTRAIPLNNHQKKETTSVYIIYK